MQVRRAMLLAAGLGTRMRPLTDRTAKPLLPLAGRALIDHALDRLAAAGVEHVVVNVHWHADRVARHLLMRGEKPRTEVRTEAALRDTGGSVRDALDAFGDEPFFVVNGDSYWLDGPIPALDRLAAAWDPPHADGVLLLHRTAQIASDVGRGDFALDPWGIPRRRREREVVPYAYAGVQLIDARIFGTAPAGPFSLNHVWDEAIAQGRLRGVVHDGLWFHLSTPSDLVEAEQMLAMRLLAETR